MNKKFFITAAIPYVNAKPHIGHVLEFVQTDTIARYHKLLGEDVLSLSGGDQNTQLFHKLTEKLNAKFNMWQKGSDQKTHFPSSQKLWELCEKKGDIFKKKYSGLYCVVCETFYEKNELDENGGCY